MAAAGELVPPDELVSLVGSEGAENFKLIGRQVLGHLIELGGLERDADVLDIGCGAGRVAVALTSYLSREGTYEGFDVVPELVRWCADEITPRHPNFHFALVDVVNRHYHPASTNEASKFRFPFRDEQFDVAVANSVFTHMLPADVERYVSEVARVLRPGGTLFASFFLINDDSLERIRSGRGNTLDFAVDHGSHRVNWEHEPEGAVAHLEDNVLRILGEHGLHVSGSIHFGSWPGRAQSLDYQDVIIATRGT